MKIKTQVINGLKEVKQDIIDYLKFSLSLNNLFLLIIMITAILTNNYYFSIGFKKPESDYAWVISSIIIISAFILTLKYGEKDRMDSND